MAIRLVLFLCLIVFGASFSACSEGGGARGSQAGEESAAPSADKIGEPLADYAKSHPGGRFVSRAEYLRLMEDEKNQMSTDKDFNDGVGTTGVFSNGYMCYCDNDSACNTMFSYWCDDDTSADYCYVYYDAYGQLWGYCQCICEQ